MTGAEKGRGGFADFQYNPFHMVSFLHQPHVLFCPKLIFWIKETRSLYSFSIVAGTNDHKFGDLKQ